jgi:hypothetical protein
MALSHPTSAERELRIELGAAVAAGLAKGAFQFWGNLSNGALTE